MLKEEWKKVFVYQYGAIVFLLFLIGKTVLAALNSAGTIDPVYERYIRQVSGQLTEQTAEFFETTADAIASARLQLDTLKKQYYSGELELSEYQEQAKEFELLLTEEDGFQETFNQYLYVREKPEERYFISETGWKHLLGNRQPDYLEIAVLLILILPMYCAEYRVGMDQLLLVSKKGGMHLALIKGLTAAGIAVLAAVLGSIVEYLTISVCYGLPNGSFPLQSLELFSGVEKRMSLQQAFFSVMAMRMIAAVMSTQILLLIAILLQKMAVSILSGIAVLAMPFFIVKDPGKFARVVGPWSGLVGTVLLRGTEYETNPYSGEVTLVFRELSKREWLFCVAMIFAVTVVISGVICIYGKNNWVKPQKIKWKKRQFLFLISVVAVGLLTGCGKKSFSQSKQEYFNSCNARFTQTDQDLYYVVDTENGSELLIGEDRASKARWMVANGPELFFGDLWDQSKLSGLVKNSGYLCKSADDLYYGVQKGTVQFWNGSKTPNKWQIVKQNLKNEETTVVFEAREDQLFAQGYESKVDIAMNPIFYAQGNLYMVANQSVIWLKENGSLKTMIELEGYSNVACDGSYLYYLDGLGMLKRYNLMKKTEETIEEVIAGYWLLEEDGISFSNKRDHNTLWRWNPQTRNCEKLGDVPVESFDWDEQYLCYIDEQRSGYYRLEKATGKIDLVMENYPVNRYAFSNFDKIYIQGILDDPQTEGMLVSLDKKTLQMTYFPMDF